jgi:predicted ATPase
LITLIELDGFKTFQDFKLELSPLQVIVGPNGAGKSNLFDALHLLTRLVETDLRSAFQELRGDAVELFTTSPDGHSVNKMALAVEMLVDRDIQDSWGAQAELKYTRMRYDLEIIRRTDEQGLERLYVTRESLKAIARSDDQWSRSHDLSTQNSWLPKLTGGRSSFISTELKDGQSTIHLHQDGHGGRKSSVAEKIERTVLSGVTNTEFPHAFAAREEIRTWKFLQLNPEVLRYPSSMLATPYLSPEGHNLATVLARMQAEERFSITDVSTDLANLVPGLLKVEVEKDQAHNQYVVKATMQDQTIFSSRVLSDGTLRMLALATLKNDPQHKGVLCFEEPENGVHPSRLKNIASLLRELATDFRDPAQVGKPLRQLLVNTHSPSFISQSDVRNALLFAYTATRVKPVEQKISPQRVTHIVQVEKANEVLKQLKLAFDDFGEREDTLHEDVYTIEQITRYLNSENLEEARRNFVKG